MTQKHMDIIIDDIVGKDNRGRVQTFGLGPSKEDVLKISAQVPSPEIVEKIRREIREEIKGQFEDYMQANMLTFVQSYLEKIGVSIPSSCIQVPDTSSAHHHSHLEHFLKTCLHLAIHMKDQLRDRKA
ncbi:hypothetical protein Scep_014632 [Stephania cephalantha]|uniref:Uncharacterized protein n=1 Tax=Stephania cephalantha TaxID=152367 RepID=A0AAP0P380_9MAGN